MYKIIHLTIEKNHEGNKPDLIVMQMYLRYNVCNLNKSFIFSHVHK